MSRVVIVSGGGTGIGRATARRFASDGDRVLLIGRREEVLRRAADALSAEDGVHGEVETLAADLSLAAEAERVRTEVARRYDRVDVLVNNAGGNVQLGAKDVPDGLAGIAHHWTGNFNSNVLTAVLLAEALGKQLSAPGRRVVLLSSIAAYRGSGSGSYAAAKAALHPYAYDMAGKLGEHGATVNVVAPGYVEDHRLLRRPYDSGAAQGAGGPDRHRPAGRPRGHRGYGPLAGVAGGRTRHGPDRPGQRRCAGTAVEPAPHTEPTEPAEPTTPAVRAAPPMTRVH